MRNALIFLLFLLAGVRAEDVALPGTALLAPVTDRSALMVQGIARWLETDTERAKSDRMRRWQEAAATGRWDSFAAESREKLRTMLGAVDQRVTGRMEEIADLAPAAPVTEGSYSVHHVRWPVFDGVNGEGLLFRPRDEPKASTAARACDHDSRVAGLFLSATSTTSAREYLRDESKLTGTPDVAASRDAASTVVAGGVHLLLGSAGAGATP